MMLVAGDLAFHNNRNDTITNPILIIEVLSKSTSSYDRGEKLNFYRTIDTVQEYLLIEQDKVEVNVLQKIAENRWQSQTLAGLEHQLPARSVWRKFMRD